MDVSDYIQSVSILIKGSHEDRLKLLFAIFDVDDDQILSAHDLFVALEWQVDTLFSDDMATITRCYELALTREPVVDYPAFRQVFYSFCF
jgi:Ca2+-binding EF-hand superfamily protein